MDIKKTSLLERIFHLSSLKTNVRTEIIAGITTFISMCYILFVNPQILGAAKMDEKAVFVATALTAIIGCTLMGFLANYPFAIAPGLGINAFFAYSVVQVMGIKWQTAMSGVFIASILFTIISFFKIREKVINAIPKDLKLAISGGIGIFIAFMGFNNGGLITTSKDTLVTFGSLNNPSVWLTIFGLLVTVILMVRKIPGAIFIGMVFSVILGLCTHLINLPASIVSPIPSLAPTFGVAITNLFQMNDPRLIFVILVFFLVTFFDTIGTLVGLAQQAGIMKNNEIPNVGKALVADSGSMLAGSILGTTPATAYVESSVGIAAGGRSGLTSIVVAFFFFLSMFFSPLLTVVTSQVTAPVLIIIGLLITKSIKDINWDKYEVAFPAFLIVIGIPFTYNISYGIALGFIIYPILMIAGGKAKKIHPIMYILFILFLLLVYILNIL